jgi:hypothetical protein
MTPAKDSPLYQRESERERDKEVWPWVMYRGHRLSVAEYSNPELEMQNAEFPRRCASGNPLDFPRQIGTHEGSFIRAANSRRYPVPHDIAAPLC